MVRLLAHPSQKNYLKLTFIFVVDLGSMRLMLITFRAMIGLSLNSDDIYATRKPRSVTDSACSSQKLFISKRVFVVLAERCSRVVASLFFVQSYDIVTRKNTKRSIPCSLCCPYLRSVVSGHDTLPS